MYLKLISNILYFKIWLKGNAEEDIKCIFTTVMKLKFPGAPDGIRISRRKIKALGQLLLRYKLPAE